MNRQRKDFLRREMLGCSRCAASCRKYSKRETAPAEAAAWDAKAAERLYQLGGLLARW